MSEDTQQSDDALKEMLDDPARYFSKGRAEVKAVLEEDLERRYQMRRAERAARSRAHGLRGRSA